MLRKSREGGNGREDPRSDDEGGGDAAGWFNEVESLGDYEEEGDGYDEHVAVNGLDAELGEEAAGDASGPILKISPQGYYRETADRAAQMQPELGDSKITD